MKIPKWVKVVVIGSTSLAAVGVISFLAFLHFAFTSPMERCKGHERFSARAWHDSAAVYGKLAVRGCAIDDFLARHPLRGARRASVVEWLGEPPPTPYFREYDMVYWLGPERSPISIDSEWLVIRLDAAGRVSEYRLVTD